MKIPEWKQSSVDNPDALDRLARNAIWGADGPVDHIRADAAEVRAHLLTQDEADWLLGLMDWSGDLEHDLDLTAKLRAIAEDEEL
jgi:hypothetical protein